MSWLEDLCRIPGGSGDILLTMTETDLELLKRYARDHAEDAFAEIVRHHLDLVHSAAFRQVRSLQMAEEVAQSVFTDLARNAHRLSPDTILTAWLYQVTRRTAIDVVRREARRQLREQIATEMDAMNATTADWMHIEPLLDEAMSALDETDRAAVLLRYFENKSLREVGQTLGTSDDAAQKRVSRAVERLREFFTKRGVTVGANGLVVCISANAVQAAPIGLAVTISTAAVTATITTVAIATQTMNWINIKSITAIIAAAVAAGSGTYLVQQREADRLRTESQQLLNQQKQLASDQDAASSTASQKTADLEQLRKDENELLRLRGEVGSLRKQVVEIGKLREENERLHATAASKAQPSSQAVVDRLVKILYQNRHFPKEAWAFAGYAGPEAALATWTWAMSKGDKNVMLASLVPEAQPEWQKLFEGESDDQIAKQFSRGSDKLAGYSLHSREMISENEAVIALVMDLPNGGQSTEMKMKVKKMGEDWKIVGPAKE